MRVDDFAYARAARRAVARRARARGMLDAIASLERLFRSSSGVLARSIECDTFAHNWSLVLYPKRSGGIPRECIDEVQRGRLVDDNVTELSSYRDMVAASWLRSDLPRRVVYGFSGVGLLFWPTARRGIASASDVGWATQSAFSSFILQRHKDGWNGVCSSGPAALGARMAELADAACRGASVIADAKETWRPQFSTTLACAWHDWEQMAKTTHAFLTAPRSSATSTTPCVTHTAHDLRCGHNQVFVQFEPSDVAAVYVKSWLRHTGMSHALSVARAVRHSLARATRRSAREMEEVPLVWLNESCAVHDEHASLLTPLSPSSHIDKLAHCC